MTKNELKEMATNRANSFLEDLFIEPKKLKESESIMLEAFKLYIFQQLLTEQEYIDSMTEDLFQQEMKKCL